MILVALAVAVSGPPGAIDLSNARTIYSGSLARNGWPVSPDCGEWAKARKKGGKRASPLETWVAGLISGYNLYHASSPSDRLDLLEGKKLSDAYKWLDDRCVSDPETALSDVTLELVREWRKR